MRALTGTDPDRLKEEKERGITTDLGFAHSALSPEVEASFVDVPGHERFVRNMLAGAHGIDAALLVVAADESVMPQTREHFHICRLLGIARGLVALTKCDVADEESQALAELEVRELVAGSFLEGRPVLPVSARTGAGLDALRSAIEDMAAANLDTMLAVNVKGPYFLAQAVANFWIPRIRDTKDARAKPKIVNISSVSAYAPSMNRGDYCMSKAAINHLTRCLAFEWASYGINVNSVAPTFIHTDGTRPALSDPQFRPR